MKTFKLISLDIIEEKNEDITQRRIKLLDGLIINREDDHGRWIIEAYVDQSYQDFSKVCATTMRKLWFR